ncbi:MAG: DNA-directed RNA polymerase subunit K [Candidatus Hodarchaeota archaeon]
MERDNKITNQSSNSSNEILIGPRSLTRYEHARILGSRALQVSMGAPLLLDLEQQEESADPLILAEMEIQRGVLPISVRRVLPDGRYQDIPLVWLEKRPYRLA